MIHGDYSMTYRCATRTPVYTSLLPERVAPDALEIGIQGGRGSFNEEACRRYCAAHDTEISGYRIQYLYTTAGVLNALHQGTIDRGVFAIQNAKGGAVMETIHALSRYHCEIMDVFEVVVSHCLLHHRAVSFGDIDTLISHPQALAQCAGTLKKRYPHLKLTSGDGDLIDQALCAQMIAEDRLPRSTAVLASRVCAELYGLAIHDEDLQDLGQDNRTTFAWVERRSYLE
jgi:prephenate dehydratase